MARLTGCTEGARVYRDAYRLATPFTEPPRSVGVAAPKRQSTRHTNDAPAVRRNHGTNAAPDYDDACPYRTVRRRRRPAGAFKRSAVFRGSWRLHPRGLRGSSSGPDRTLGQRQRHAAPATRSAAQRATAAPQPNVKTKLERVLLPVDLHLGTPHAVRRSRV